MYKIITIEKFKEFITPRLLSVVCSAGKLDFLNGKKYCFSGVYYIQNDNGWFEITAKEYVLPGEYNYEYGLIVEHSNVSPLISNPAITRPYLKEVEQFPNFCRLDLLKANEKNSKINLDFAALEGHPEIIRSMRLMSDGVIFEFVASEAAPESVEIHQISI